MTIYPREGLLMFPVLEPFGSSLEKILRAENTPEAFIQSVIYPHLYDSTLIRAQEFPEFNRFTIKGKSQSSSSSDISLGTFNIPRGSVQVYAGGQRLTENVDYVIDYNIGRLSILNASYIQPGTPIRVSFEDNALFSFQKKTMLGLRADYEVNKHMNIGATYMHLFERPYTEKVNIGDDPINNRVYGLDLNYSKEAPWVTKLVDKLPVISTKEPSILNFQAEVAALKPGHSRAINGGDDKSGVVYIDDFEGTASEFDLRTPETRWQLASTPQKAFIDGDPFEEFPESQYHDSLIVGVNRAHFNWYRVDRSVRTSTGDFPWQNTTLW
jgi:cell surface protein SprA